VQLFHPDNSFRDPRAFHFDHVYAADTPQERVYQDLARPLVDAAFEVPARRARAACSARAARRRRRANARTQGFSSCVFAYGQTGSGKTYSMTGTPTDPGLAPRAVADLFRQLAALEAGDERLAGSVTVSYTEIYNEGLTDLLGDPAVPRALEIRESALEGVHIKGLREVRVASPAQVAEVRALGDAARRTACHRLNAASSRSHTIFTLRLKVFLRDGTAAGAAGAGAAADARACTNGRLHLVDLAGSERLSKT
jgi:centromeric protein E